jgi:hypothetical protein
VADFFRSVVRKKQIAGVSGRLWRSGTPAMTRDKEEVVYEVFIGITPDPAGKFTNFPRDLTKFRLTRRIQ